jgi:hypothetical protein
MITLAETRRISIKRAKIIGETRHPFFDNF